MTAQPLVSVIMATYNRGQSAAKTIKNIFEQTYRPIELIVINDGSTDDTLTVLKHLKKSINFILIDNPKNLGLQKSLNRGAEHASGKYLSRIDDHDLWLQKSKLSKQIEFLEKNPEIGLVGTGYRNGNTVMTNPLRDAEIRKQILMRCPFCHVTVTMRRDIFDEVGGYDESLPYSEDWDLWLKFGRVTQMANLPDITTEITEATDSDSLSGHFFLKQLKLNRQLIKKYENDFPGKFKARGYHRFVGFFFSIFNPGGAVHRLMQVFFRMTFLK